MKLFYSPFSPFARKVWACAVARGIDDQISLVRVSGEQAELVAVNPLGKLPCLVTDDGTALFDSRVICEFLDGIGEGFPLFPEHGLRVRALRLQALGDGMSDAAVLRRWLAALPPSGERDAAMAIQKSKVDRSIILLAGDCPAMHLDIGTLAIACALGYLDLRYADEPWRTSHPALASWFSSMISHPCLATALPG